MKSFFLNIALSFTSVLCIAQIPNLAYKNEITINNGLAYFKGELFTGVMFENYENNKRKFETHYVNGTKNGNEIMYDPSGKMLYSCIYNDSKVFNGFHLSFYENTKKKELKYYKNGKRDSLYKIWDTDGNLLCETTYKNDSIFNGKYLELFEDGRIKLVCNYKDGLLDGTYEAFFEDGSRLITNYSKGLLEGTYKAFTQDGELSRSCNFFNGKLVGEEIWKFKNDPTIYKSNFKNGFIDNGWLLQFYPNGNLKLKSQISNGQKNMLEYEYSISGKLIVIRGFLSGKEISSTKL